MKTEFSLAQLADPISRKPTRSCGPACIADFAPRPVRPMCCSVTSSIARAGGIYLIKEMLEKDRPPTQGSGQAH